MHYDHARAIYLQIMDDIRQRIISGEYQCDEKIAPVRELAVRYEVNPNTMQKALTELEQEGLLYTKRTSGRFVTNDAARIEALRAQVITEKVREWIREMRAYGVDQETLEELVRKELNDHETDRMC